MSFNQSTYVVKESDLVVNPVILISNPVSKRFNVIVFSTDQSATGRYFT